MPKSSVPLPRSTKGSTSGTSRRIKIRFSHGGSSVAPVPCSPLQTAPDSHATSSSLVSLRLGHRPDRGGGGPGALGQGHGLGGGTEDRYPLHRRHFSAQRPDPAHSADERRAGELA